jgi:hypothetical protein
MPQTANLSSSLICISANTLLRTSIVESVI